MCLCPGLHAFPAPVDLVLLQTPREQKHALNTGRIVKLGVQNCRIIVGENFSEHSELNALLDVAEGRTWLLYPGEQELLPQEIMRGERQQTEHERPVVIVLDATWRKSRKMLHLCPRLGELPKVVLPEDSVSRYRIRKVPGDGFISTVEATVALLEEIGHPPNSCQQMLDTFDRMIQFQIDAMGKQVWEANYSS